MKENYLKQRFYESVCAKKIPGIIKILMFLLFVLNLNLIWANAEELQQRKVTGTVTDSKTGDALPGVNIMILGSVTGTIADSNGQYSIDVPNENSVLVFSFIGFISRSIKTGGQSVLNVTLDEEITALKEVVVTALGINREKKALGYAVQDVSGEAIRRAASPDVINSLTGKSAGVYINNSSGNVGASSRITIRGNQSIKGENQPLFVVDGIPVDNSLQSISGRYDFTDIGSGAKDINPADIANVTILKGGSAAALYGSRGANGVILITTKTGGKKGFSVELENSTSFSNPLILPDYQNEYGQGGYEQYWYKNGLNAGKNDGVDETFGPRLDYVIKAEDIVPGGKMYWAVAAGFPQTVGQILMLPQFNSPIDPETGERTPTPWISHPNNVRNFFETGIDRVTNVSLSNGGKWGSIRLSLTNAEEQGMVPNTNMTRNTVAFSGNTNLTEKLSFDAKVSFNNNKGNLNGTGYNDNNIMMQTLWSARQVDWEWEKTHYQNPDGTTNSWINRWHDNPYWMQYKNLSPTSKNRVIASTSMKYQFTSWLSLVGRIGTDYSQQTVERKRAYYGINNKEGLYQIQKIYRQETNADFLLSARKEIISGLTLSGNFGGNIMNRKYDNQGSSVAKLAVPDVYALSNAKEPPTATYTKSEKEIQSLYASVSFDYKGQLFLDLTGRNDWSSTLPADNNSYFYPSATASWIFSETFKLDPKVFSFGKVRLGIASVGNDTDPYMLSMNFVASKPYSGYPSFKPSSTLPPLGLVNELINSNELGFDLKFFSNRLGLDLTLYKTSAKNQIMDAVISGTSGFSAQTINAGQIDNKGVEVILSGTPIETPDFSWDILLNWSKNKSLVVELYGDIQSITLYNNVVAPVGGEYGIMMGTDFIYHANGKPIVDADGVPLRSDLKPIGNIMPDWISGITNTFRYKNISLSALIDARVGADLLSWSNQTGFTTGVLKTTTGLNANGQPVRDPVETGGGYLCDGVYEDGTPNTTYLYLDDFRWTGFPDKKWVYDASYVKLREVALSYSFPGNLISKLHMTGAELSVYGRNLALLYNNVPNLDPEVSNLDASISSQGHEFGANPSARTIGFRIKLIF